jgi:hypothetical protein
VEVVKKVPLSLEELLAKKKAEEEALSKVFNVISYSIQLIGNSLIIIMVDQLT